MPYQSPVMNATKTTTRPSYSFFPVVAVSDEEAEALDKADLPIPSNAWNGGSFQSARLAHLAGKEEAVRIGGTYCGIIASPR